MRASIFFAILAGLCLLIGVGYWLTPENSVHNQNTFAEPVDNSLVATDPAESSLDLKPQLYCIFYRYTKQQPRLELLFNVDREDQLRFRQLYLIELDGSHRTVDAKEPPFPEWSFDDSADPARLSSEITVFDNSAAGSHKQPITIEIYDYQAETASRQEYEAGLKSVHYQPLPGQCTNVQVRRH